jgi:hypothetical protein
MECLTLASKLIHLGHDPAIHLSMGQYPVHGTGGTLAIALTMEHCVYSNDPGDETTLPSPIKFLVSLSSFRRQIPGFWTRMSHLAYFNERKWPVRCECEA